MKHYGAFLSMLIPLLGLFAICRGGRWKWKVVESNEVANGIFWIDWVASLVVGLMRLFALA